MNRRSQFITIDQLPGASRPDQSNALGSSIHAEQSSSISYYSVPSLGQPALISIKCPKLPSVHATARSRPSNRPVAIAGESFDKTVDQLVPRIGFLQKQRTKPVAGRLGAGADSSGRDDRRSLQALGTQEAEQLECIHTGQRVIDDRPDQA